MHVSLHLQNRQFKLSADSFKINLNTIEKHNMAIINCLVINKKTVQFTRAVFLLSKK